jgi:MFS family permease
MSWRQKSFDVLPALSVRGRNLRQSLRMVTAAWMWGVVWMTCVSGDQMRAYAKMLGFNDFAFGLLGAIPFIATLGQLPAAIIVERTGLRKYFFLYFQVIARFLWIPIALVPFVFPPGPHGSLLAVTVSLLLIGVTNLLAHLATPPWFTWMGDLVPRRIRGRYFARRAQFATAIQVVVIIAISVMLDRIRTGGAETATGQPLLLKVICGIFAAGALFGMVDILLFTKVREIFPPRHKDQEHANALDAKKHARRKNAGGIRASLARSRGVISEVLLGPLRDKVFRNFVCYGAIQTFSITVGGWYFWLQCREELGFNALATNSLFLVIGPLSGLLTSNWWGRMIDRWGRRPTLIISTIGTILSVAPWWFLASKDTPSPQFLADGINWVGSAVGGLFGYGDYNLLGESARRALGAYCLTAAGSVIGGMSWWGLNLTQNAIILGFSDGRGRNKFVAASSVLINLGGVLGGIVGGIIAQSFKDVSILTFNNYKLTFAAAVCLRCVSLAFLLKMPDPGAKYVRDLMKVLGQNAYTSVITGMYYPFRLLGGTWRAGRHYKD